MGEKSKEYLSAYPLASRLKTLKGIFTACSLINAIFTWGSPSNLPLSSEYMYLRCLSCCLKSEKTDHRTTNNKFPYTVLTNTLMSLELCLWYKDFEDVFLVTITNSSRKVKR